MAEHRTPEEVRNECIATMGEELGAVYYALWNEIAWLNLKWGEYVELFGSKESRVELLNRAAGRFFRVAEDAIWEDVLLHIARLTDPATSPGKGRKENLTIHQLPQFMKDGEVRNLLNAQIDTAKTYTGFCRDWRNRRIAHKDLRLALKDGAEPLQSANRAAVDRAIHSLEDVLNFVPSQYFHSETYYKAVRTGHGAMGLIHVLDDGLRREEERKERRSRGEQNVEDYKSRDL